MIKKWLTVIGKTILLLIGITFLSFLLVYHSPGDPAMVALKKSGMRVSEKALELKREELGLNDPFAVQYGRWLNEFFHGDLGESYKTGKAVAGELKKTIPATLLLTVAALALTILISFPIGVLCAKYKDRGFDNMIRFVTYFLSSLPSFFLALLMMYVLSMKLQLLPVIGLPRAVALDEHERHTFYGFVCGKTLEALEAFTPTPDARPLIGRSRINNLAVIMAAKRTFHSAPPLHDTITCNTLRILYHLLYLHVNNCTSI